MSSPVISLICCPIRERYESFGLGGRYRGPLIPQPVKRRHGKNKMRERFSIIDKSTMTKRDFIELSEKTFNDIEQLVDDQYPDVDFDREGNVLTLTLEDGKVVVINRQEAMEEMWLASPLGGMHFYYDAAGVLVNYPKGEKPFAACLKEAVES